MSVAITVDLALHPLDVVLRASHGFTRRCSIHPSLAGGRLTIELTPLDANDRLEDIRGQFANALLDQHLRMLIAEETKTIRELLVAQAFCEADLIDRRDSEGDEYDDPRGIVR